MAQLDSMNEQEQMQMLMSELQDSNLRQSVMQYITHTAYGLDKDANSKALIETLARESVHNQKSTTIWKSRTKKSVTVGIVAVVLAVTVQFLVNYFTNELSKESHVTSEGAMVSTGGKVVKTQMDEMMVGADGKLVTRTGDSTIKTTPSLAKVALASSLPDATLMALDEIAVHSDKGYTLQIKVHGFSRIPVLNSRCGNVVHFYTAWKGKVTLDSTDLTFDEATAAEFKNAGFTLALGGRRLSGKITVDGFAKALDGMKKSGSWTCADVPLPTMSQLGSRKEINFNPCGSKEDLNSLCYSKYGGLKFGAEALAADHASTRKQTSLLYVQTSSTVMNSVSYRVSFEEYPQHPGQQLVSLYDAKADQRVTFQLESGKSRSHCQVGSDAVEKNHEAAKSDGKIDTDWHFEFLGTSEESGRILRHFRIMLSEEFASYMLGDEKKASLANFAEFWDVADTMQPYRFLIGDGALTVFDSFQHRVSDSEVVGAVRERTGKNMAELMVCSDVEKIVTQQPEMNVFLDLSEDDVSYYQGSEIVKSEAFENYLDRTHDTLAMPDHCYDSCRGAMEALKSKLNSGVDMCEGSAVRNALECLDATGKSNCQASVFADNHLEDCEGNSSAQRALQESEDEDAAPLLLNDTKAVDVLSEKRNLFNFKCKSKMGAVTRMPGGASLQFTWCVKWAVPIEGVGTFSLMFKWGRINGFFGLAVSLTLCANFAKVWSIPPPLELNVCVGGSILVSLKSPCPQVPFNIFGKAYFSCAIELTAKWVPFSIAIKIELGFAGGMGKFNVATRCWWVSGEGSHRRRWWSRRRRNWRRCNYRTDCDIFVRGYIELTIVVVKARLEFNYWIKNKTLVVLIKLFYWFLKWRECYQSEIYRKKF